MNRIIITTAIIALLASCGKKNKKQYSYWKVNGVEYSSNNVDLSIGRFVYVLQETNSNNWFILTFYGGDFDFQNTNKILLNRNNPNQTPTKGTLSFYVNNKYYGIDNDTTILHISTQNGKARFSLAPRWYSHYENGIKDSVLIEAILNEP
ncbi:MAG TPA: hypothetical protein PKX92_02120 [Edaphocola sp.]|nr:hypothetical protein [Edaphocola sp.]